jgi:hypothetical protein
VTHGGEFAGVAEKRQGLIHSHDSSCTDPVSQPGREVMSLRLSGDIRTSRNVGIVEKFLGAPIAGRVPPPQKT